MSNFAFTISAESLDELLTKIGEAARLHAGLAAPITAAAAAPKAARAVDAVRQRKPAAEVQTPVATPVADADLKKTAIQKLVTLINANDALGRNGKQVCTDLCNKFGGKNISAIPADKYGAVIAEVDKALEALNSDPTA